MQILTAFCTTFTWTVTNLFDRESRLGIAAAIAEAPAHTKYRAAQSLLASIVALTMATGGSCSSPSPHAPAGSTGHWLAGSDDIPRYEYEYVAHDERTRRLDLVPELVIGERPGDADPMTFEWQVIRYRLVTPWA